MRYEEVQAGTFLSRPNRFVALVELSGNVEKCHVKNTGRCRELLVPGARVYLEKGRNPDRKTAYDLIGVEKGSTYINMDSQAPNQVAREWLTKSWDYIKPEYKFGNSRLDFYMEQNGRKALLEVKGVTLEEQGIARFPDAPTERGIKHLEELQKAIGLGYETYVLFVIQMKGIRWFEPNDQGHPAFGEALRQAAGAGVKVLAYDCIARPKSLVLDAPVEVRL